MNIWLNPDKLRGYGLSASQVLAAVRGQNVQFAAGSVGAEPSPEDQAFTATVSAEGRYSTAEQFGNIILRAESDGTTVRLKDVARVEKGASAYGFDLQWSGTPASGFAVQLAPGANALGVAGAVSDRMDELQATFPQGVTWFSPYDSSTFVETSIVAVVETLFEAIVLVFLVMLIFLQNFRATLIPTLVIPVALMGTFVGLWVLGFTINQLSLFGMVLAIGIVVDDAIIVIENVERIMTEEGLSPKDATIKAMGQISGAVVAVTVVLAAVFVPSAFQAGSAGEIYKQFAVTIAMAMGFSAFLALGFTPALCASILKPTGHHETRNPVFRGFNKVYDRVARTYVGHIGGAVRHAPRWMLVFAGLALLCGFLFTRMPGSFLPEEDQGYAMAIVQLPPGATLNRTKRVFEEMRGGIEKLDGYEGMMQVAGFSFVGQGENVGMAFIKLKPWDERDITAQEFIQQANGVAFGIRDAQIFVMNLPTVNGLGQFGGFDMYLQDRSGQGRDALAQAMGALLGKASQDPTLTGVRPNKLADAPQLRLDVDRTKAQAVGVALGLGEAGCLGMKLPTVNGRGQFGGFDMYLQERSGQGRDARAQAMGALLGKASQDPTLTGVRPNTLADAPQLRLDVDRTQAQAMGLSVTDIYNAISLMLAPVYINDFTDGGRVKRVTMQADSEFRTGPESLSRFYTPAQNQSASAEGASGEGTAMIPISNVVDSQWTTASPSLSRYNGYAAVEIVGSQAPGHSSGEAMAVMQQIVENDLPPGFGYDWTGQSYQEILSGNQATMLMVLSILVVFLCLAALYESWSVPVAVLLVVPLGVLGAVTLSLLRGLPNDIYFKIGLITVIGLAAKNAILIIEFAIEQRKLGRPLREAVIEAARLRFRPILMTSFAFIMGVLPMAVSTGAGANARHAIGTGVIGGMLFATFLGLLLIPVFYVVVRRLLGDKLDEEPEDKPAIAHE